MPSRPLTKLETLPEFAFMHDAGNPTDASVLPVWSGKVAPPNVGDVIEISINAIGPATVDGYATLDGYLGVMATPHNPPSWHSGESALVFGAEIKAQR